MKAISKRVLCILTSLMMLLPLMCVGVSAEVPTTYVFDANNITVNSTHTEISGLPGWIEYDAETSIGVTPKVYKQTNILGLTGGESALEFVSREERVHSTKFQMQDVEFEADGDFYITMNFYLGDARDNDFLVLNGQYSGYKYDGSAYAASKSDINSRIYMRGTEQIAANAGGGNNWATYEKGNWYRYTLAAKEIESGKYEMTAYIDDTNLTQYYNDSVAKKANSMLKGATDKNILIKSFGFATVLVDGTSGLGGRPQWWLIKDMQLVEGTYNPEDTRTGITSSDYTVQTGSFAKGGTLRVSSVTGVPANTSVSTFLGNIAAVDTGATKQVVKIAEDNLATTVMGNDAIVTSAMKLLVTSTDGSMKLYDIDAAVDASLLPVISSNANYPAYVVNADTKTISIPDTTAAKLKERITLGEGTTVKVVDVNGFAVNDNKAVTEAMKLVASKNNNDVIYDLEIIMNQQFFARMGDTAAVTGRTYNNPGTRVEYNGTSWAHEEKSSDRDGDGIYAWQDQGQWPLYAPSYKRGTPGLGGLLWDANGNAVTPTAGAYYSLYHEKIPGTEISAFKAEHSTGSTGWARQRSLEGIQGAQIPLDKTIVNYKIYLTENSAGAFMLSHSTAESSVRYGLSVGFVNGEIRLGTHSESSVGFTPGTQIGNNTYKNGQMYDVTIVQATPDGVSENMIVEAIYIDDTKIYPTADNEGVFSVEGIVPTGLFQFEFETLGTVYWGDIQLYMADNYAIPESAPAAADLLITSDDVTITGDRIYGWEGIRTVADLKAAIDSAATTEVEVLNIIGSTALAETAALENGMLFRVTDKNHPENTAYYVLAKTTTDSGTTVTVAGDKVTATRQVLVYTAESSPKNLTVILAVYEGDTLVSAKLDTKTIQAIGDYDFEVEIEGYNPATMTYKAFAWNLGTLVPYEGITD